MQQKRHSTMSSHIRNKEQDSNLTFLSDRYQYRWCYLLPIRFRQRPPAYERKFPYRPIKWKSVSASQGLIFWKETWIWIRPACQEVTFQKKRCMSEILYINLSGIRLFGFDRCDHLLESLTVSICHTGSIINTTVVVDDDHHKMEQVANSEAILPSCFQFRHAVECVLKIQDKATKTWSPKCHLQQHTKVYVPLCTNGAPCWACSRGLCFVWRKDQSGRLIENPVLRSSVACVVD